MMEDRVIHGVYLRLRVDKELGRQRVVHVKM